MIQGIVAPWRVVLQRSRADWLIVAATWLVVLCATTLLAIGVIYGDAVATTGLRRVLADAPVTESSVSVSMRVAPEEIVEADEGVSRQLRRPLGWSGGSLVRVIRSESFALPDQGADDVTGLAVLASMDLVEDHASLTDGAWPVAGREPIEAALSSAVAEELALAIGDEIQLTSRVDDELVLRLRIVGAWRPNDPSDAYWLGDPLELDGVEAGESFTTHGPFIVGAADLLGRAIVNNADVEWRALPTFDRLQLDNVRWMRSDVAALDSRLDQTLPSDSYHSISTSLDVLLSQVSRSLLVSRSGVLLLTIQFAVLAGYALVLVAGLLMDQRRIETALLRSRGAGPAQVAMFALLEGLLLVIPAALLAPWLAVAVLGAFDRFGPLASVNLALDPTITDAAWWVVGGVALACLVVLVIPALFSIRALAAVRQARGRGGSQPIAQRLGVDVALVAVAGIGLWQLRQYGAPITETVRGGLGIDPFLVAAPAIGLLAGAIVALRLVPLLAQLAERAMSRRRGLVAALGARQLARRPLRYTRSALLLMLAASLGTFAAAYGSTWTGSQHDQAAYQAGGELRVTVSNFPDLPDWGFASAYVALDGVERLVPVVRERFDAAGGLGAGELLALPADQAGEIVTLRPDLATAPLETLMTRLQADRPDADLPAIPGEPRTVTLAAEVSLHRIEDEAWPNPIPEGWRGILPTLVMRDATGLLHRFDGTRLVAGGGPQRSEVSLVETLPDGSEIAPVHPLELVAVELDVTLPQEVLAEGVLRLDAVEVDGRPVDLAVGGDWRLVRWDAGTPATRVPGWVGSADAPIPIGLDAGSGELEISPGSGTTASIFSIQPAALAALERRLPALVGADFMADAGLSVDDLLPIGGLSTRRELEIIAVVDAFPTADPARPFAVVDATTMALAEYAASGITVFADEWWLEVDDDRADAVAVILAGDPYSADEVTGRAERAQAMLADPVALGLIGALTLGSLAAVLFAGIGFAVSAVVSTRERLGEFALLRALGLSPRQLSAWLSLENAFLLGVGVVAGTGLGLLLAWVALPFITLSREATAIVPGVRVVMPWEVVGLLYALATGALVLTVIVIGGVLRRVPISDVLRAGEE